MMVSVRSKRISAETFTDSYLGSPRPADTIKLLRSFPEEKFPPLPLKMMNLTLSSVLAYLILLVSLLYMSRAKALYLLGRLKVIHNLLPLSSDRTLVDESGSY